MKKKLALSIISMDECFPKDGYSGGGHKVTKRLIEGLIASDRFEIDIFCQKSSRKDLEGINSINVLDKKSFIKEFRAHTEEKNYDYILSSDILVPFANNVIHSNSSKYKSENGKHLLLGSILRVINSRKIKKQEKNMSYKKAIFTVSQGLKKDFCENFNLEKENVFVCHPAVDFKNEFIQPSQNDNFILGSIAGGGLNKGGYLLLLAMKRLPKTSKVRAKVIFPKYKKSGFFRACVKFLGLEHKIEVLAKQSDMNLYYRSIDCYVLPSLNEAFGLVVTEAASNSKPSIISCTTGVSELFTDNLNGFIFNRRKEPVKNLTEKILFAEQTYFDRFDEFCEIAKKAHQVSQSLDWKKFSDIIIENMIGENS